MSDNSFKEFMNTTMLPAECDDERVLVGMRMAYDGGLKAAAQQILTPIIQEETRHILAVGDPRVTTVSSRMLALLIALKAKYGLDDEGIATPDAQKGA